MYYRYKMEQLIDMILILYDWLLFRIMYFQFIHIVVNFIISLRYIFHYVYIAHLAFIHLSWDTWVIYIIEMYEYGIKISSYDLTFKFFRYIPRCGISGTYSKSILISLRNCHISFPQQPTILYSYQQCTGVFILIWFVNGVRQKL